MTSSSRVMLLIDADNVSTDVIEQAISRLHAEYGALHVRRAYCTAESAVKHQNLFKRLSIRPMVNLAAGKNSTDIALAVDALDLVMAERPDVVVIASSDSDFAPLVSRLREKGCQVRGFGQAGKVGEETPLIYDDFLEFAHRRTRSASEEASAGAGTGRRTRSTSRGGSRTQKGQSAQNAQSAPSAQKSQEPRTGTRAQASRQAKKAEPSVPAPMPPAPEPVPPAATAEPAATEASVAEAPARKTPARKTAAKKTSTRRTAKPAAEAQTEPQVDSEATTPAAAPAQAAPETLTEAPTPTAAPETTEPPPAKPARKRAATPRKTAAKRSASAASAAVVAPAEPPPPPPPPAPTMPAEVAELLRALPSLADTQVMELQRASEQLRKAGLLSKRYSSRKLLGRFPDWFDLQPPADPVRVILKKPV